MISLRKEENVTYELSNLYKSYGYSYYKMSNFEEYDLYAKNRNFLESSRIITFNDLNGKLMALKPDVTLSIIKNTKDDEKMKKIYYTEHVYRVPHNGDGFKEIMQTGLECIGDIDTYSIGEVISLAAQSLAAISDRYILDISHLGITMGVIRSLDDEVQEKLLEKISEKNAHGIRRVCERYGVPDETRDLLVNLISVYEPLDTGLERIREISLPEESRKAAEELETIAGILDSWGIRDRIYIDFSIVNDMDYYNGIFFKGFIDGIADGILSGGQYDNLMDRMGKRNGAVGFAVYLDQLEELDGPLMGFDADVLIKYDENSDINTVISTARKYTKAGNTVRVQKDGDIYCQKVLFVDGMEVKEIG